jgi:Skp family chaperone for outer membrane proteins
LRQLIDAGTLSNLPAGFKAKGARIMNDDVPIQPGEWRDMDAGGSELTSQMLPLPYKEPSQTLYQLLGFCVEAGQRLANTADMAVGDGNQYAAVGTTIALLERGSMVMSSIHKRLHYAQKQEFQMLAKGFAQFMPEEYPYDVPGASRTVKKKDFDNLVSILPVADPNIFSSAQRVTLAQTQLQLAQSAPQMHNMYEAYHRMYAALNVRDIDAILTPQHIDHPKDPATENADAMNGMPLKAFAGQQHDAHIVSHLILGLSPTVQANPAAAINLQQHLFEHLRIKAEEQVAAELFNEYGTDPKDMVSIIQKEGMIAIKVAQYMQELKQIQTKLSGDQSDPLVDVKKEEIAATAKNDAAEIAFKQQKLQQDTQIEQQRIGSQEHIAMLRANTPAFKGAPPNATPIRKQ